MLNACLVVIGQLLSIFVARPHMPGSINAKRPIQPLLSLQIRGLLHWIFSLSLAQYIEKYSSLFGSVLTDRALLFAEPRFAPVMAQTRPAP